MQTTTTDTALVELVQRGDHHAYAELVRRHDRGLRALATRLLRSPERVDDALQESYLKAFRSIGTFRRDATVATWLYPITYNTCLDELRRRGSAAIPAADLDRPTPERGPAEHAVAGRRRPTTRAAHA